MQALISKFGYKIDLQGSISQALNKLMSDVNGTKEQNLIDTLAIRSMSKEIFY
jgi:ribonuclease R